LAEEKHSKMEKPPVPSREEPSEKKEERAPEKKEEIRSSETASAPEDKFLSKPEEKPPEHKPPVRKEEKAPKRKIIDTYEFRSKKIPINITVVQIEGEFVPVYEVSISSISKTTEFILEKIRQELIKRVNLGMLDITDTKKSEQVEAKFEDTISDLINKYFPDVDDETKEFLISYLIGKSLGLGNLELLMSDINLEEVVVNQAAEPVWVYHRKHGWLKTNIYLKDEDQIRHYSSIIGRKIGRQITVLKPLLDAYLTGGDRVKRNIDANLYARKHHNRKKVLKRPMDHNQVHKIENNNN